MTSLKLLHISLALLSITGFTARFVAMVMKPAVLGLSHVKILPHIIDTLLLFTGITLAWQFAYNPIYHPWLMAKLILLIAYIFLGAFGLRYASTLKARISCCVLALMAVSGMVWLARVKPLLFG
ncbi:MAG: SirB2 family protein [Candidatus Pelagadaptatus aseana]|uniref:SirB2 family protein n=1 Tax=Candidatus Pelagadaptatus aseana TaxID=3120508 RepID=UPI0039B2EF2E